MKILHVVPYFAPAWGYGGTPRAVYEIAARQVKEGHQVTVLTSDAFDMTKSVVKTQETIDGIQVYRVPNLIHLAAWKFHFVTPGGLPSGLSIAKFDIIHLHEVRTLLNFFILRAVRAKQVIILSPWGTLPYNDHLIWVKKLMDLIFLPLMRKKIHISTGQNDHEASVLKTFRVGRKQVILPLGVTTEFFRNLPNKTISRRKLHLKLEVELFVFLGRFSEAKGLKLLFHSFAELAKRKQNVFLLCVGRDDGYLSEMKDVVSRLKLEKKVWIHGPLYERDRLLAYRAADTFIFTPIVYEETSTACLEALLCGTPVITTKQAAIPFLTQQDGVREIQAKQTDIISALNSRQKSVNLPKVRRYFSWSGIVRQLDKIYAEA